MQPHPPLHHAVGTACGRVLCLGAAFKAGVSDVRNSRAVKVMELLEAAGARVDFADPLVRVAPAAAEPNARR